MEEQDPSPEYINAFNNGYVMQRAEPNVLEQILRTNNKTEYVTAMQAGAQQFLKDKIRLQQENRKERNKDVKKKR